MATTPPLDQRYSTVAIWLHWIIAALLVANLLIGLFRGEFGRETASSLMWWHKGIGLTVLGLTLVRLAWRAAHRPPPFDAIMKRWEKAAASAIHAAFYLLLIAIPLTGWLISSTSGRETDWFGLFDVPPLPVSRSEDAHELAEEVHEILAKVTIGLILLHVAGAVKHHLAGHRHLVRRMAPSWRRMR